jgi:hypothetical protein
MGSEKQIPLPHEKRFLTLLPLAPTPLRGFSATPTCFFPAIRVVQKLQFLNNNRLNLKTRLFQNQLTVRQRAGFWNSLY